MNKLCTAMPEILNQQATPMTVDIRLCGNIPRKELGKLYGAPCSLTALTSRTAPLNTRPISAGTNGSSGEHPTLLKTNVTTSIINSKNMRSVLLEKQPVAAPVLEPPSWAVPASGETTLEPVCEALGRQTAVDLTTKKSFRVGRSPLCDVQLMHATSSRRHAMLFHHSNGSCYIVDCGSAHGTFVNGKRISSPSTGGIVVPHKVRRGALIRFGGPGAPCFVLKSFSFVLKDLSETPDVRRNTRLNALGRTAQEVVQGAVPIDGGDDDIMNVLRKRSFDSLSSRDTLDLSTSESFEPSSKRLRCSSPPVSPEVPLRLVSPDLLSVTASKPRRVTFSMEQPQCFYPAVVTPEESSDEQDL